MRRKNGGFTLVELLVVIAIIGILIALLLPAVQAAREAARRSQCTNNLKQLGLGLHNYHDTFKGFPASQYFNTATNKNESTWVTHLLPFIEQKPLFDQIKNWEVCFGCFPTSTGADVVISTKIPGMLCPSDVESVNAINSYAKGNYLANTGIGPMETDNNGTLGGPAGVFRRNRSTRMADLIDGTSNTAMLSETLKIDNVNDWRGVMHYPEGSAYQHNRSPNSSVPDELRASMCVTTLPRAPCVGVGAAYNNRCLIFSARSLHPGGVNVALADGSIRFVSNSVNLITWQNLGIAADGNVLGEF